MDKAGVVGCHYYQQTCTQKASKWANLHSQFFDSSWKISLRMQFYIQQLQTFFFQKINQDCHVNNVSLTLCMNIIFNVLEVLLRL